MSAPRDQQSFLLNRFREFYAEVVRLRAVAETSRQFHAGVDRLRAALEETPPQSGPAGPAGAAGESESIWTQLLSVLERQAIEAGQTGGAFAFEIYREAQYVMAALADEIFLNIEWEAKDSWPLLEARLFQTQFAGEAVFQQLDRMLLRRDPFYLDLAVVYFMALSLGFQGKFRGDRDLEPLFQYRRLLFNMIYRRNPKLFAGDAEPLFPQNGSTVIAGLGKKLPDQRIWLSVVGIVLIVWLAASGSAWSGIRTPLDCLICQVMGNACACDAGGK
jgi:type VI secretion system protein ImpK